MMIDKRTGKVLGLEVDNTYWKVKFLANLIAFTDHKISCCKVEGFHALDGIYTPNI